jgi:site-specific recombinase XerD
MEREADVKTFVQYLQRRFPERRTSKDYESDVRQFMKQCDKPWRQVRMQDIDGFIDAQRQAGMKPATIKRRAAALKTFFDFLAEESEDLGWPNPVRMKRHAGKQPKQLPRDLHDRALEQLWSVINSARDRAWFALMLRAGLRVGEVAALTLADLLAAPTPHQAARLRVCGKGRKERIVLLSADAYAVLQGWLAVRPDSQHDYIFINERDGGPLSVSGIEYCLSQYSQQAGVACHPHQLRHTYARQLTEAGMPITTLSRLMGHSQVTTTQAYTSGADPSLEQAYQQAFQHLADLPLPAQAVPVPAPAPTCPDEPAPVHPEIHWEQWLTELPTEIRQVCIAFVQRRYPTWKGRTRAKMGRDLLISFRQFWTWLLAERPIQHPHELTLADLHAYQTARAAQAVTTHTVDLSLSSLVSLYRELADQGLAVDARIFRWQPRPRPDRLPRDLPEAAMRRLEARVTQRLDSSDAEIQLENLTFLLLAHSGLRAGECLDLCLADIDQDHRRLTIRQGKGMRDRVVYYSVSTERALSAYLHATPRTLHAPLLVRPNGKPLTYLWLFHHFRALAAAAEVTNFSIHRLRHTFATRMLNAGMDVTRIQKLLGHEHLNTTMIYARVLDQTLEADYRRAMHAIELQQMPLSDLPIPVEGFHQFDEVVNVH